MQLKNRKLYAKENYYFLQLNFWEEKRHYIWVIGVILRILITPFSFKSSHDYYDYRLPVAISLAEGGGLYDDVHYNHMPIYPYISALAILLVGTENETLTAIAIKLPIAIADSLIPIIIYKIGIRLNYRREGLMASLIYAVNPLSILEVQWARWDSFASLTVVLAFYLMLQKRSVLFGLTVALGFMLKQFPLFIFGLAFVYWRTEIKMIVRSIVVFSLTTIIILCAVLLPFDTSLSQMISDLSNHPSYQGYSISVLLANNCHYLFDNIGFCYNFEVSNELFIRIWLLIFLLFQLYSLLLFDKNLTESNLIEVITLELTLLSLFFINRHVQYVVWLLPWVLLWAFKNGGKFRIIPIFLMLGYFGSRIGGDHAFYHIRLFGDLILAVVGITILVLTLHNLKSIEIED